jgi:serine/threonine-protein kinase
LSNQQALRCKGAEQGLAGIWDASRKPALHQAFQATGKPYAEDAWRGVESALDRYAGGWVAMNTEACEATRVRGTQSEALLDLRMECLRQRQHEVRAVTDLFVQATPETVTKAMDVVGSLASLDECANGQALMSGIRPPPPAQRSLVDSIRAQIAQAKALQSSGQYPQAAVLVQAAATDAQDSGYRPVQAEALQRWGEIEQQNGHYKEAEAKLSEAIVTAEATRHDQISARAWNLLLFVVVSNQARYAEAARLEAHARAAIERLGSPDALMSHLAINLGLIAHERGKYEEAISHNQRALELTRRSFGPDSSEFATVLNNMAGPLFA